MGTMKRFLTMLVLLATVSTAALAGDSLDAKPAKLASKAVQMTDDQLDDITAAGAALHTIVVSNGGNAAPELRRTETMIMCINCELIKPGDGTFVELFVANKGHPPSDPVFKLLGRHPGL